MKRGAWIRGDERGEHRRCAARCAGGREHKYPDYVEIDPYDWANVDDCAVEDGWMYLPKLDPKDSQEPLRIALCGKACADYQSSGVVDIEYGCGHGE